jgi:hypothetical protein
MKLFKWYDWFISNAHYDVLPYREVPGKPAGSNEEGYRVIYRGRDGWTFQPVYLIHNLSLLKNIPVFSATDQQELILKIFRERNSL